MHLVDIDEWAFLDKFSSGVHEDEDTNEWTFGECSLEHVDEFVEDIVSKLLFRVAFFLLESKAVNLLRGKMSLEFMKRFSSASLRSILIGCPTCWNRETIFLTWPSFCTIVCWFCADLLIELLNFESSFSFSRLLLQICCDCRPMIESVDRFRDEWVLARCLSRPKRLFDWSEVCFERRGSVVVCWGWVAFAKFAPGRL